MVGVDLTSIKTGTAAAGGVPAHGAGAVYLALFA
jgi:hypothetical protein